VFVFFADSCAALFFFLLCSDLQINQIEALPAGVFDSLTELTQL
jgi:hypothetical protein